MGSQEDLPDELKAKIASAREMSGRPHAQRLAQPATVAETLHLRAHERPEQPFLIYYAEDGCRRERTYLAFYKRVRVVARMMRETLGLKRGDRVLTAMHNHDQTILITFAAWHLGLTVVPLNMGEDDKRLGYVLEHSGAKAIFVLKDYAERMRPMIAAAPAIRRALLVGTNYASGVYISYEREVSFQKLEDGELERAPEGISPDAEALIVYTSGTTGAPKGVVLSQYNLIADAHSIAAWHELTPEKRMMCVLPIHHVNGLIVTHVTPVFYGGSVVQNRKFSTSNFFKRIAEEHVHVVSVVPTLLQFLIEGAPKDVTRASVPGLSHIICGAGPLTVDLAARFEDRFGVPVCHGYGLSETTCYSCFLPIPGRTTPAEHKAWMRDHGYPSIGVAVAANEMAIHDDHGQALPEGAKGEIVARGHNVTLGYASNRTANENAFTHGWFRSGDEGFWKKGADGRAYYFISGRFKELIIRGGVKISPLEVDEVINRCPGVKAGMAVGFENTTYGEEVGAYIVKQPGAEVTPEQVIEHCRKNLAAHAAPKVVVFGETFPVTSTGKYQRNQLKGQFAEWKDAQFK
ncbi:MAG: AMP-binding protein [Planctomycetota bacterium]|nr:AMP-binding protein [Planctomycetota bacterium]